MTTVLKVDSLKKSYGQTKALQGVSFSVREGTCFGLLGPNGAGKSTAMKILTGIVNADAGQIEMLGLDARSRRKEIQRQIGYVPQNITLYEKLSVWDNLVFFGEMYGIRGKGLEQGIGDILEQIGLTHRKHDKVENLSGGMKRRINIACALIHQPKILILDEPTVGVDPQSRNHIFEMIRNLLASGVTVIYSTHYMEEVETLSEDVAIIDQGQVIADGSLTEVLDHYGTKTLYVETDAFDRLQPFPFTAKITRKGTGWSIETDHVMNAVKYIIESALDHGIEIMSLEIVRPSLEAVFLSLTGTSLRD